MRKWLIAAWTMGAAALMAGALACGQDSTNGCNPGSPAANSQAPIQQGDACTDPNTHAVDQGEIKGDVNHSHKIACLPGPS